MKVQLTLQTESGKIITKMIEGELINGQLKMDIDNKTGEDLQIKEIKVWHNKK